MSGGGVVGEAHLLPPYGVPSRPCCGPSEEQSAAGLLPSATPPDNLKPTPPSSPRESGGI